jgi:hypothetical protein
MFEAGFTVTQALRPGVAGVKILKPVREKILRQMNA